jgi:hypothetical protein
MCNMAYDFLIFARFSSVPTGPVKKATSVSLRGLYLII